MMESDQLYTAIYRGIVTNVLDPKQSNRVRIRVPGICEPDSVWAEPKGMFGSALGLGMFGVPPQGSEVFVQFEAGNLESPIYEPTGIPFAEIPEELRGALNKWGLLFGDIRLVFELLPSGKGKLRMYSKALEAYNYIELDGETNSINVKSLTTLNIEAQGLVTINGAAVLIQNRPVVPGGKEI